MLQEALTLQQRVSRGAGHRHSGDQHYIFSLVKVGQGAFGMVCFGKKFWGDGVVMSLLWGQEGAQPNVAYQDCTGGNPLNKTAKNTLNP